MLVQDLVFSLFLYPGMVLLISDKTVVINLNNLLLLMLLTISLSHDNNASFLYKLMSNGLTPFKLHFVTAIQDYIIFKGNYPTYILQSIIHTEQ